MKTKSIFKYFFREIFNPSYLSISLLLEVIFFLLLFFTKDNPLNYLKYLTIFKSALFFINLSVNRIKKQELFFVGYRNKLLLANSLIYLIFLVVNSLIYFLIFNWGLELNNFSLDYLQLVDYFAFFLIIFLIFLDAYTLGKNKAMLLLVFLFAGMILLVGPFKKYNFFFPNIELNKNLYLKNNIFEILIEESIYLLIFILSSLKSNLK